MRLHFEDFTPGWSELYGPLPVSKDDIVAFAREFDPQPFHTDEEAAKDSFLGTLVASGWHTCSLNMRLIAEGLLLDATSMGAPGIEEVKWLRPVRPGDTLRGRATVLETRASRSRPDLGLVHFSFEMLNQADQTVMTQTNWVMFGRRGASPLPGGERSTPRASGEGASLAALRAPPHPNPLPAGEREIASPYLEDLVPGETEELGAFTFTAEEIIRFAKAFDPQPFHVDPEAAQASLFGGLCASGWHTAAVWMRHMIGHRQRVEMEALRRGERPARLGPSPGFKNLKWLKPVYAGDTIAYRSEVTGTRPSASRPGWGLAFHRNSGVNQHGEEVFSFDGMVFWERRE